MKARPPLTAALVFMVALASSAGAATTLSVGDSSGAAGTTVNVPLYINTTDAIVAVQLDLTYPDASVAISGIALGEAATAHEVDFEKVSEGRTRVVVYSETNATLDDGIFLEIDTDLSAQVPPGNSAFSLAALLLTDASGNEISASFAPFVAITAPGEGESFDVDENVSVTAVAIDAVNGVTEVEFFVGGTSIGIDSSAPYAVTWTPTASGNFAITAMATSGTSATATSGAVNVSVDEVVDPTPPRELWRQDKFTASELANTAISGFAADPDGDGLPNLLEYALGLEPKSADMSGLPALLTVSNGGQRYAAIEWSHPDDRSDITFHVDLSSTLTTWDTSGDDVISILNNVSGGTRERRMRSTDALGSDNLYLRLRVETVED